MENLSKEEKMVLNTMLNLVALAFIVTLPLSAVPMDAYSVSWYVLLICTIVYRLNKLSTKRKYNS